MSKALVKKLPTTRSFSEVEAMFSLTVNYDCSSPTSISGLASRWMWSRKRVANFLKKYGVTLEYNNKYDPNNRGQVGYQVGNRLGTGREQVEFIDSKHLPLAGNRLGTGREQVGNRLGSTIKEPNPNPDPKEENHVNVARNGALTEMLYPKRKEPSIFFSFAEKFYEYLAKEWNGKKKITTATINAGAETIDKLVRIDGFDLETEIKPALRWALTDEFWSKQIGSLAPLRSKSKNGEKKFVNLFSSFAASNSGGSSKSPSGTCNLCTHLRDCNGKTMKSPACGRYEGGVAL